MQQAMTTAAGALPLAGKLCYGLIKFDRLMSELPEMIVFLDQGETVDIEAIRDQQFKTFLQDLLQDLSKLRQKRKQTFGQVISSLLEEGHFIKPQPSLSSGEALAVRAGAPRLMRLLQTFPDLKNELKPFLEGLLENRGVDLGGIDDEDTRNELTALLRGLGFELDASEGEDVYVMPADRSKERAIAECIEYLIEVLYCVDDYDRSEVVTNASESDESQDRHNNNNNNNKKEKKKKHKKHKNKKESKLKNNKKQRTDRIDKEFDDDSSFSEESDEGSETSSEQQKHSKPSKKVGPSLAPKGFVVVPLHDMLDQQEQQQHDEDIGPSLSMAAHLQKSAPPLSTYAALSGTSIAVDNNSNQVADEVNYVPDKTVVREEWMLDIGENRVLSGAFGGGARKFQTGKQAKKAAELFAVARQQQQIIMAQQGISSEPTANDESRGPSLMELHQQQQQEKNGNNNNNNNNKMGRQSFDRERDLLGSSRMNSSQVAQLVQHAKELPSRFDRGSFQRGT